MCPECSEIIHVPSRAELLETETGKATKTAQGAASGAKRNVDGEAEPRGRGLIERNELSFGEGMAAVIVIALILYFVGC